MSNKVVKVESWEAFRHLIDEHNPDRIIYTIRKADAEEKDAIVSLTIPIKGTRHVFTDSVAGDRLRETGILLRQDGLGSACIRDEDVVRFVRSRISRRGPKLISSWTHARGRKKLVSAGVILLEPLSEASQEKPRREDEVPDDLESLMARARALLEEE
ncbi:MAG: hypothetical protein OEZ24_03245 [Candidatus Bathyarchaeota archaeon]|nr:hypothetical protein [Candidatus Bathyarchaeota archaeon]